MRHAATTADPEAHLVDHVPDELCVRVDTLGDVEPQQLYDQVRAELNQALAREVRASRVAETAGGALARDLTPVELRRRFAAETQILQPLERPGLSWQTARASSGVRPPWHTLAEPVAPRPSASPTAWHLYYAVGRDRVDFDAGHLAERQRRLTAIRELVNLVNHPSGVTARSDRWSVAGANPNWLTVAAQFGCGCPAALPEAEPRVGGWQFRFDPELESVLEQAPADDSSRSVVAILDTCPSAPEDHGNPYLAELLRVVRVHAAAESAAALHDAYFEPPDGVTQYLGAVVPWWPEVIRSRPVISDHGLFVAGIIHAIAPEAEIHLIRVLSDSGVGDELGLGHVLSELPAALDIGPRRRLIVNLSLGATVPVPPRRHWARWLPSASATADAPTPAMEHLLQASHQSLLATVDWLLKHNVLIVAAAGNDALRPQTHAGEPPPPRYPARYQAALSVAATTAAGSVASYSNRADVPPYGNGIATFGGDVGDADRVIGVYSAEQFPDGTPNVTGWARWAGTSFSTPIVAGIAARLWPQVIDLSPDQLMQRIRGFARQMQDGDASLDAPRLNARQVYVPAPERQ